MNNRSMTNAAAFDETRFERAVVWRVHCPVEALQIAESHQRHAAEALARGAGWDVQACRHDEKARFCEAHAEALRSEAKAPAP